MLDILIIEPNPQLVTPYSLLTSIYRQPLSLTRVDTFLDARKYIREHIPGLVMLSSSFAATDVLNFLVFLSRQMMGEIIPLIWITDLHQPLSQVLGTAWGGQVAVLSSEANVDEVRACLCHLLTEDVVEGRQPEVAETVPDQELDHLPSRDNRQVSLPT